MRPDDLIMCEVYNGIEPLQEKLGRCAQFLEDIWTKKVESGPGLYEYLSVSGIFLLARPELLKASRHVPR